MICLKADLFQNKNQIFKKNGIWNKESKKIKTS